MGPAACTVNGEKVHINLLEESWMAPFLRIGYSVGGLFLSFFFFSFPLISSYWNLWLFWLGPNISDGFRDGALQTSLLDSSCRARSRSCSGPADYKEVGTHLGGRRLALPCSGQEHRAQGLNLFFARADARTKPHCVPEGFALAESLGIPIPLQQVHLCLSSSLLLACFSSPCHLASSSCFKTPS